MKKMLIVILFIGLAAALQACAAFYSCGTGGSPVQYRIDKGPDQPGQEK